MVNINITSKIEECRESNKVHGFFCVYDIMVKVNVYDIMVKVNVYDVMVKVNVYDIMVKVNVYGVNIRFILRSFPWRPTFPILC